MQSTMKEYEPLISKGDKQTSAYGTKCKLFTALSFILIVCMAGVAMYGSGTVNMDGKAATALVSRARGSKRSGSGSGSRLSVSSMQTYKGAVLEYQPLYHESYIKDEAGATIDYDPITSKTEAIEYQTLNIERMTPFIEEAAEQDVDILVLSEFALQGLVPNRDEMYLYLEVVPDPEDDCDEDEEKCRPCDNDDFYDRPTLQKLSCLAKENEINLVVNYGDVVYCDSDDDEDCPDDGRYQYNTEIVFDFSGLIVAKYWKIHTYNEPEYDTPDPEEPTTFTVALPSDPNTEVTFGIIICYDSMYATPLLPLVHEGVTDFVMSHWWVNTAPSMNIAMWTQAVSKTYGINLLVAASWWVNDGQSYNKVTDRYYYREFGPRDSSGSGLFSKGTVIDDFYNQDNEDVVGILLTGNMPIGIENNAEDLPTFEEYETTTNEEEVNDYIDYCENSAIIAELGKDSAGVTFTKTLDCATQTNWFKCVAEATIDTTKIGKATSDDNKNYLWMYIADGFYQTPDGGDVWYYEQFCALAICDEDCYNFKQGDTSHTIFESISLSANFNEDATFFVMTGDRHAKSASGFEVTQSVDPDTLITTFEADDIDKVLLDLSIMGRTFSKDKKIVSEEEEEGSENETTEAGEGSNNEATEAGEASENETTEEGEEEIGQ